MIKRQRVQLFNAALVGGPSHRDYLTNLGMPADRITLGYNAVDNFYYHNQAASWRNLPGAVQDLPKVPFFLSVCRFVPEKNLLRLIDAFTRYRDQAPVAGSWDLVLCGDGSQSALIRETIRAAVMLTQFTALAFSRLVI